MTTSISIAVMTSGGDAQGMNPAIRAITRLGVLNDAKVFAVHEGYQGLVDGNISQLLWDDVSGLLGEGGTALGSSRCFSFKNDILERRKAVHNLVSRGIDNLICIGGDGSLSGADKLREEWPQHLTELVSGRKITKEVAEKYPLLRVVGLVGSIDNDMCGTDITIGAYSALTRIVEALDAITTTASSHQRLFVVEIMGRACGWLALQAGLSTGADWVFIPENPPKGDWKARLITSVRRRREGGSRYNLILVAEGAVDVDGQKITVEIVKNILESEDGFDTRITVLGHLQRGGVPCAADRTIGTLVGLKAVEILLNPEIVQGISRTNSWLVGMKAGEVSVMDLMEAVNLTKSVAAAMEAKNWSKAFELRGTDVGLAFKAYHTLARAFPHEHAGATVYNIGLLHVGPPAPGMNGTVRAVVRQVLDKGSQLIGFYNGFMGLNIGDGTVMKWKSVSNWTNQGGALLGTNRTQPSQVGFACIASQFRIFKLSALIIVGGWEAYTAAYELHEERSNYPAFSIPIIVIPSSISNNCPGSDFSIGSDTALNTIVEASDRLKKSATSTRCRVFVMETMGGKCGYLTLMAAIAGGAQVANIPEKGLKLKDISADIERLKGRFKHCRSTSLILHCEKVSKTYSTEILAKILDEESEGYYDVRHLTLGHLQQGNYPSPIDRIRGISLAHSAVHLLMEQLNEKKVVAGVVGFVGGHISFTKFPDLLALMDFKNRRPKNQWWMSLISIVRSLRGRPKDDQNYRPLSSTIVKNSPQLIRHFSVPHIPVSPEQQAQSQTQPQTQSQQQLQVPPNPTSTVSVRRNSLVLNYYAPRPITPPVSPSSSSASSTIPTAPATAAEYLTSPISTSLRSSLSGSTSSRIKLPTPKATPEDSPATSESSSPANTPRDHIKFHIPNQ